jgi:hypothetical protein
MSDAGEGTIKSIGVFSTLQAATEVKFFLLSATFILLIDNVFLGLNQPGIFELVRDKELMDKSNLAIKAILIFVGFSFLTSIILPLLAIIFDGIYLSTVGRLYISLDVYLNSKFGNSHSYARRECYCVTPLELREEAHKSKDKYLLDLYKEYETKWHENRKAMMQHALFSFYCLAMLCWNYYLSGNNSKAAAAVFANYFGSTNYVWYAIFGLLVMVLYRFFENSQKDWIYCPSLSEQIEKQNREKLNLQVNIPPPHL